MTGVNKRIFILPAIFLVLVILGAALLFKQRVDSQSTQQATVNQPTQIAAVPVYTPAVSTYTPPAASTPNSSSGSVKQLPQTGAPAFLLVLTALIPLGLRFRKYGEDPAIEKQVDAIFEKRIFKKLFDS